MNGIWYNTYIPNFSNVAALGLFRLFTYNSREKEEGFVALKFKSNILYTNGGVGVYCIATRQKELLPYFRLMRTTFRGEEGFNDILVFLTFNTSTFY